MTMHDDDDTTEEARPIDEARIRAARREATEAYRAQLIARGLLVPRKGPLVEPRYEGRPVLLLGDLPPERHLPRRERYPYRERVEWPRKHDRS